MEKGFFRPRRPRSGRFSLSTGYGEKPRRFEPVFGCHLEAKNGKVRLTVPITTIYQMKPTANG